jgi:DNA-binding GntR family transcriptional regulator
MPEYQTMIELAVTELRKAIMRGDLPPGTRLVPAKLGSDLNLSRVSVREAIRELCGSMLAETTPNVGARVASPPSLDEIEEIFKMRILIEPRLAVKASERMTKEEIGFLQQMCKEMEKNHRIQGQYFLINRKFHETIYQASGSQFLWRVISQFVDQIMMYRSLHRDSRIDLNATNLEHRRLVEAMASKDKKAIKALTVSNIKRGLIDIKNLT